MAGGTTQATRILFGARDSAERGQLATRLATVGHSVSHCTDEASLARRIDETIEVVILADELAGGPLEATAAALAPLPDGHAMPFLLLSQAEETHAAVRARLPEAIRDFILLEEPVGSATLLSCLATCARLRQHQLAHRRQASERANQRARFERLIENLPIGVCFIDTEGNTLLSNPRYDEYVPDHRIPSTAPERARRWLGLDSQGQVIPPSQYVGARALRGEQVDGQDYRYFPDGGGERWLRLSSVPLYDGTQELVGAALVIIDVDAEKRNEGMLRQFNQALEREVELRTHALQEALDQLTVETQERNRAEELLRHSQKMDAVGQLTGGIAHDFNNMLTGIIGALDLIRRRPEAGRHGDLPRYLDAAQGSAQRAAALTQRLLAFSRRQSLQTRPTEVNALVHALAELLQRSLGETTAFELDLADSAGLALADPHQLENALLNLTLNARDAMPDGGCLRVETGRQTVDAAQAARHDVPAGDYVRLSVIDTGVGIAAALLDKVFEPFFTTKPLGQGTGLGLSMVYGFVRQSRGFVTVHSRPGEGTAIALYLPAATADVGDEPATSPLRRPSAGEGQSILVVEDDDAVRLLLQTALEDLGYRVHLAADSQQALGLAAHLKDLDLLLTDVGLPGLNGRQLAEMIQQERAGLPVVLITGYAEQASTRADFLGPGMRLMTKPFALEHLADTVASALASPLA